MISILDIFIALVLILEKNSVKTLFHKCLRGTWIQLNSTHFLCRIMKTEREKPKENWVWKENARFQLNFVFCSSATMMIYFLIAACSTVDVLRPIRVDKNDSRSFSCWLHFQFSFLTPFAQVIFRSNFTLNINHKLLWLSLTFGNEMVCLRDSSAITSQCTNEFKLQLYRKKFRMWVGFRFSRPSITFDYLFLIYGTLANIIKTEIRNTLPWVQRLTESNANKNSKGEKTPEEVFYR